MAALPRQWIGSIAVGAVGAALAVMSLWGGYSHWLLVGLAALVGVGLLLTWPGRDKAASETPEAERSAFVRGDASGSTFDDVVSDGSDSFIEGNAIGAIFRRVIHRAPRRPHWPKDK